MSQDDTNASSNFNFTHASELLNSHVREGVAHFDTAIGDLEALSSFSSDDDGTQEDLLSQDSESDSEEEEK
jgi:hypothetical protein